MKRPHLVVLWSMILMFSCKKEEKKNNNNNNYSAVSVLNDNSGFEHVWDTTTNYGSIVTSFHVNDFTVDPKNRMHFVYYENPGQYVRRSWDLTNKSLVQQHPEAADELEISGNTNIGNYTREIEMYKPYTNYYVAAFHTQSDNFGYSKIYLSGDVSITSMPTSYFIRIVELGYENVVASDAWDKAHMYIGLNKKDDENFNYRFTNTTIETAKPFPDSEKLYYLLCDARTLGKSLFIGFNKTGLKAIEFDRDVNGHVSTGNVTATANWNPYVEWKMTTVEYPEYKFIKAFKHYSVDGTKLSFALMNINTYKFTTFTYNFTTKQLKKVLEDVALTNGRIGSSEYLYDLDDDGNLYYAGYAANGTNDKGISIYKISSGNQTTLVGTDNFLKFGRVAKLKFLHGKLYLAITGTKTGTSVQQLSFIRQK